MKKLLFSTLLIGICLTGVASAKEKNPILLKQVYKKEELIVLDKQNVAGGNGTLHGKFAFTRDMATGNYDENDLSSIENLKNDIHFVEEEK